MEITRRTFVAAASSAGIAATLIAEPSTAGEGLDSNVEGRVSLRGGRTVQVLGSAAELFELDVPQEIVLPTGAATIGGGLLVEYDDRVFRARDSAVIVAGDATLVAPVLAGASPGSARIELTNLKLRTASVARELRIATPLDWRLDEIAGPVDDLRPVRIVRGDDSGRELAAVFPSRLSADIAAWEILTAVTWDPGTKRGHYPFPVAVRLVSSGPAPVPPGALLIVELDARLFDPPGVDYVDYRMPDVEGRATTAAATAEHGYEVTASRNEAVSTTVVEFGEGFPVGATWNVVLRNHPLDAVATQESAPAFVTIGGPPGGTRPLISGSTGFQSRRDG